MFQNKSEDIIKKWLELRKKFPSAKVKPKKVVDCREQHSFFKSLKGCYIDKLRVSILFNSRHLCFHECVK